MRVNLKTIFSKNLSSKEKTKTENNTKIDCVDVKFILPERTDEEYLEFIRLLRTQKKDMLMDNGSEIHSTIVLHEMVADSNKVFKVFDKDLSGDLLENTKVVNLLEKFKEFVSSSENRIEIIVEEKDANFENMKEKLKVISHSYNNIKLYTLNSQSLSSDQRKGLPYFAVNDNNSYRYEVLQRKAKCNFSNPKMSKELNTLFENLKSYCEPEMK